MSHPEEGKEVFNENETLEIRKNQADMFLHKEIEENNKTAFLIMPFVTFISLCLLYISWFNFWSVLLILFIVICVCGAIAFLAENREYKKYLELIYMDTSVLEKVEKLMEAKKEQDVKQEAIKKHSDEVKAMNYKLSHPQCPNCGSTNTKPIGNVNRAASVAMWGLASSKIGKQYQCNRCNHKW